MVTVRMSRRRQSYPKRGIERPAAAMILEHDRSRTRAVSPTFTPSTARPLYDASLRETTREEWRGRPLWARGGVAPAAADELTAQAGSVGLPGRTQHIVFSSTRLAEVQPFYRDVLGFVVSDEVIAEDGRVTACFLRSDELHHSYAVFQGDGQGYDHHALEVDCWNDIRDWGDHFASLRVPIWWGPGRHGPGNNLFFMIRDPDGNRIELSAEQELMPREMAMRTWPHDERTLNLWGNAWMRS